MWTPPTVHVRYITYITYLTYITYILPFTRRHAGVGAPDGRGQRTCVLYAEGGEGGVARGESVTVGGSTVLVAFLRNSTFWEIRSRPVT